MLAEALHGLGELALEGFAPHLAVGDDWHTGSLLKRHRLVNRPIFEPLELRRRNFALQNAPPRLQQPRRPEQTSHHVHALRKQAHTAVHYGAYTHRDKACSER